MATPFVCGPRNSAAPFPAGPSDLTLPSHEVMPEIDELSCPYCGRKPVHQSGRHADYEALLPWVGVSRLRCASCDRRFYRLWSRWNLRAPEAPVNLLRWSAILLPVCAVYLYLLLRR
jgi:hypothetical protein